MDAGHPATLTTHPPMADPHGKFVWYDLMTTQPDAAKSFYGQVAGWGTQKFDAFDYTMWVNGPTGPLGGVMPITDEHKANGVVPHWLAYVAVDDVDAAALKAASLGGSIAYPPTDIPTVGRFAVLQDPQGAYIAIYRSSSEAPSADGPPAVGQFSWHELMTTDHAAAFDFYHQLFGWEKTSEFDMGPMGVYQMYGQGGVPYGGMMNKPADVPMPPNWGCYIKVRDAKQAAETVTRLGGQVINGPMEVPGGDMVANCIDPQGAYFSVHASKA